MRLELDKKPLITSLICSFVLMMLTIIGGVVASCTYTNVRLINNNGLPATKEQERESDISALRSLITEPPVPKPGKASISGLLYTSTGKGPIPGTLFYLTLANEEDQPPMILVGPREEMGDVRGTSDEKGRIALDDIEPGNYYLVVWAPYNWIIALESEVDTQFRLIKLEPGQRLNLGIVYVQWP